MRRFRILWVELSTCLCVCEGVKIKADLRELRLQWLVDTRLVYVSVCVRFCKKIDHPEALRSNIKRLFRGIRSIVLLGQIVHLCETTLLSIEMFEVGNLKLFVEGHVIEMGNSQWLGRAEPKWWPQSTSNNLQQFYRRLPWGPDHRNPRSIGWPKNEELHRCGTLRDTYQNKPKWRWYGCELGVGFILLSEINPRWKNY